MKRKFFVFSTMLLALSLMTGCVGKNVPEDPDQPSSETKPQEGEEADQEFYEQLDKDTLSTAQDTLVHEIKVYDGHTLQPVVHYWNFDYNAGGQLVNERYRRSEYEWYEKSYEYDGSGRMTMKCEVGNYSQGKYMMWRYSYDGDGRVADSTYYQGFEKSSLNKSREFKYQYDAKGRVIMHEENEYTESGSLDQSSKTDVVYRADGQKDHEVVVMGGAYGGGTNYYKYIYNAKNQLIKREEHLDDEEGALTSYSEYSDWTAQGQPRLEMGYTVRQESVEKDGTFDVVVINTPSTKTVMEYDAAEHMILHDLYYNMADDKAKEPNWQSYDKHEWKYDQSGRVTMETQYQYGSFVWKNEYIYDAKGRMVEYKSYFPNPNRPANQLKWEYNDKGQLLRYSYLTDGIVTSCEDYKYDKFNRIESVMVHDYSIEEEIMHLKETRVYFY